MHATPRSFLAAIFSLALATPFFGQDKSGVEFVWNAQKASAANAAIMEYLGEPVPPPADLDAKYTPAGLTAAVQDLARRLNCSVRDVKVDDSEFPFLIAGSFTRRLELGELKDALATMPGYAYSGSSTGRSEHATRFSLNMMPASAYSREKHKAERRTMIRLQMLMSAPRPPDR